MHNSDRVSDEIRKLELLCRLADKYPRFRDMNAVKAFKKEEGLQLEEGMRGELVLDTGLVIDLVYVPDGEGGYVLAQGYDPLRCKLGILYHGCGSNRGALEDLKLLYQLPVAKQTSEAAKG